MRELKREKSGQFVAIFRMVPELNADDGGFLEQWYFGEGFEWEGIRVKNEKKLIYAEMVSDGQGLYLGPNGFYGINVQDKFYDERSFLVNGAILTASKRRENFGRNKAASQKIKVGEQIPEKMISILAESKKRVLETAGLLKLPLESEILIK